MWQRPAGFFHGAAGSVVVTDLADVAATMQDNFSRAWNAEGNKSWVFRKMFDLLRSNTNIETFLTYVDDAAGSLRDLILTPQREDALQGDYVHNTLKAYREKVEPLLAPFTTLLGNTLGSVKTASVQSYDYDASGNVIQVERVIPVATAMGLALSTMTQYASHGKASGVAETPPRPDALFTKESNGRLTRNVYGEMYQNPDTKEVYHLLLSKADSDLLVRRFRDGLSAYSGEVEAFNALRDYFNEGTVADTLEKVANQINPGQPFKRVTSTGGADAYYPINSAKSESDARAESRDKKKTLDENKRILARMDAPAATILQDPVAVMYQFENAATDVISYARTVDNMVQLVNALDKYDGPRKEELRDYLKSRINQIQNYRQNLAEQRGSAGGAVVIFDTIMRKYSRSVLNSIGSGLKQSTTFGSAFATNIIDAKYLRSSQVLSVLSSLTAGGYTGITARGDLDISGESDRGLSGVGGIDTAERPYIEKLLGNDITDPEAKQKHLQRWATVINRMMGSANQFVDGVQFEDFGLNNQTLNSVQKKLKQADVLADRYFTTINQRIDRGVVFAWAKAAELAGVDQGLSGDALDAYTAKTTTEMLYQCYSLTNLTTRSPLSLNQNFLYKMLGLYSSQSQTQGNLLLRAIADWSKAEPGSAESQTALRQLYSTAGWAIMFNAVGVSVIGGLSRALLAVLAGDEPDDASVILEQAGYDSLRNVVGSFPGIGSAMSDYLISTNDTINSGGNDSLIDFPAAELIQRGLDSVTNAGVVLFAEDEKKADKALDSLLRDIPKMAAQGLGIPLNLQRVVSEQLTMDADNLSD